jgi:transposase
MKRKSRGAKCQKGSPFDGELKLIEADAAAIDVGSRSHWVAVNPQRDREAVREFGAFTTDLMRLAEVRFGRRRRSANCATVRALWEPIFVD